VLGLPLPGEEPGTIRTTIYLYAPVDGHIDDVSMNGGSRDAAARYTHEGRQVAAVTADLVPGGSNRFTFDVVSGPGQTAAPKLRITPGANGSGLGSLSDSACS
jgi:hypothetical protein